MTSRTGSAAQRSLSQSDVTDAAERLRTALDLFDLGVEMLRTRLRREDPTLSDEALDQHVQRWLLTRRGAEHGDGAGRPGSWPRSRV
jgi:hypothetical protein